MNRLSRWWRAAVLAGAAIVTFDAVASVISRTTGFDYPKFAYGSYLIQAAAGFFGRRTGLDFWRATLLGTWTGLIEATVGWAVSWWIGPGRIEGPFTTSLLLQVLLYVAVGATLLGAIGAGLGGIGRDRRSS